MITDTITEEARDLIRQMQGENERLTKQLVCAKEAIRLIVKENADFRAGMPKEWEGDPLQDAIDSANFNVLINAT